MTDFEYTPLLPLAGDDTPFRRLDIDGVEPVELGGQAFLRVAPAALTALTAQAMFDIAHYLRPGHLQQLRNILDDPEACANDRFVALDLLKNANVAGRRHPAHVPGHRHRHRQGQEGPGRADRAGATKKPSPGASSTPTRPTTCATRQMAPLSMWEETNTKTNLPAEIKIARASTALHYEFLFMAKGGGSANKSYLYQETKALLTPDKLLAFLDDKLRTLGTAACPPYHLAVVIGGTSAEMALETAKLASTRYLDSLPKQGSPLGHAYRDVEFEAEVLAAEPGVRDRRPVRRQVLLPRRAGDPHAPPRRVAARWRWRCRARPTARPRPRSRADGVFLEQLEPNPARFLPEVTDDTWPATSSRSTSTVRWTRSAPSCRRCRSRPACR